MDTSTIKVGLGVGDLRLGTSPATVREQLGPPREIESGEDQETWYYETLSVLFEGPPENRLMTWCDASEPLLRIGQHYLIGKDKAETEAIAAKEGLTGGRWSGSPESQELLIFDKERIHFRFFDGKLEEVSIGAP